MCRIVVGGCLLSINCCVQLTALPHILTEFISYLCHRNVFASQIIANIGSVKAIQNYDGMLEVADGVVVGRANLGMCMTPEKV